MMQAARFNSIDSAGEIGWGMLFFCCGLSGCLCLFLPGDPLVKLAVSWLLILCGIFCLSLVPLTLRKYIARTHSGAGVCRQATRGARLWILISLALVVGGSIRLFFLMLPEMTELKHYQALHPGAINHIADRFLLLMFVVPGATLYVKACSLRQHRWKWFLLPLIVLVPIGLDLSFPGNFSLIMLILGLVWLVSGGATLYSDLQPNASTPAPETT
ncbi:MAG: hypothetical protein ABSE48_22555 [Verrucomicrobiota bacterium]|jgi:hypothetical protein